MLKKILFSLTLLLLSLVTLSLARAAITNSSRVIPYQGRLTDSSGNNVADSTYAMTFKIYTVSSGGSAAFTETFSAGNAVTVSSGLFSVLLGSLSANGVNLDFANPPYYLGITVASNSEMTPRIQIGFTALAHNSQYLDGTPLSSFQLNTGVLTGAAGTNTRLQATGTGTGSTGSGSIYFLDSSGNTKGRIDTNTIFSATGGSIATASGYTVHTFTSSGTFTLNGSINVEYLVVGGGGSSDGYAGGGAGGVIYNSSLAVTPQSYTVTVGSGGVATGKNDGGYSSFGNLTAIGGGASGRGGSSPSGNSGGSGGGRYGACFGGSAGTGTVGPPRQGYDGGTGGDGCTAYTSGGGGGGGGGVGQSVGQSGSNGGAGVDYSAIFGTGVGSSGWFAGGGAGWSNNPAQCGTASAGGGTCADGTANTGGGGGGNGQHAGGSGIVIIRYPTVNYGTMYLGSTNTSSADLAEYYVSGDKTLTPGDVVSIAPDNNSKGVLLKSNKSYDSKLVGVISTNPGVVLGSIDGDTGKSDKRQLALAGRVPVKIDPDSEPIEVGDFLTSSNKPGLAKKATESGYVIGKALENWTGPSTSSGQIEVFINLIYANADKRFDSLQSQVDKLRQELDELRRR